MEHGKAYDPQEDATRKEIFRENFNMVTEHNQKFEAGIVTYEMGINKFSDWTPEEVTKFLHGVVQG